jgi:hypothetical protein
VIETTVKNVTAVLKQIRCFDSRSGVEVELEAIKTDHFRERPN